MLKKIILASGLALSLAGSLAMPVFADTTTTTPPANPTLDVACIQSAVDKRDTAIIAAVDAYHDAIKSALQTRLAALKTAWAITSRTDRRTALKNAWSAFTASQKLAAKNLKTAKKNAWTQFSTDRKACGKSAAADDNGTSGMDTNL